MNWSNVLFDAVRVLLQTVLSVSLCAYYTGSAPSLAQLFVGIVFVVLIQHLFTFIDRFDPEQRNQGATKP